MTGGSKSNLKVRGTKCTGNKFTVPLKIHKVLLAHVKYESLCTTDYIHTGSGVRFIRGGG